PHPAPPLLPYTTLFRSNGFIATIIPSINTALTQNIVLSAELLLLGVLLAAVVGALLGFVASFPAIRLREDYLGMLLLASAQLFQDRKSTRLNSSHQIIS